MTFKHWLIDKYCDKQDRFGTFARWAGADSNFPNSDNLRELRQYIRNQDGDISSFNMLWHNYKRDLKNGYAEDEMYRTLYYDTWKFAWELMRQAMRYEARFQREKIWEDGMEYFRDHMCVTSPTFAEALLDAVKEELDRSCEMPF